MEDECCGGDPPCWAHLFEDDDPTPERHDAGLTISIFPEEERPLNESVAIASGGPTFESDGERVHP
jgi:hypothetical protein